MPTPAGSTTALSNAHPGARPSAMKNGLAQPAAMLSRRAALGVEQAGLVAVMTSCTLL
jgi:hypothetical protein